jgi:hypothetical protein
VLLNLLSVEGISGSNFVEVKSFNPYWETGAKTFEDLDGYRVVINGGDCPF